MWRASDLGAMRGPSMTSHSPVSCSPMLIREIIQGSLPYWLQASHEQGSHSNLEQAQESELSSQLINSLSLSKEISILSAVVFVASWPPRSS